MRSWVSTGFVLLLVLGLVMIAIRSIIKAKKNGKSCGYSGCHGCPMAGDCHKKDAPNR
ncbi:MAG: FeoB-associated Cys-rich membrane protein [Clostridia bacterium]|nr:FeoB-associated Cys-rich membrane protein [Clostridia bacterium]